jgi:protein-disulfide isomerase
MDTYNEHNSINPINEIECEPQTELEEQQEWNQELVIKNKKLKAQLEKLAEIEQCIAVFGTLTYDQLKEKQEILNQYIK